jgi:ABC-type antimicrobial peptide transport system permease subunit
VSHIVAEQTREIGIRMALGAQVGDVRRLFLRHRLTLTIARVAIGLGAAVLMDARDVGPALWCQSG